MLKRYFEILVFISVFILAISILRQDLMQLDNRVASLEKSNVVVDISSTVFAEMQEIRSSVEENSYTLKTLLTDIQKATEMQIKASNQIFAANSSFINWALANGYIEEVVDE